MNLFSTRSKSSPWENAITVTILLFPFSLALVDVLMELKSQIARKQDRKKLKRLGHAAGNATVPCQRNKSSLFIIRRRWGAVLMLGDYVVCKLCPI